MRFIPDSAPAPLWRGLLAACVLVGILAGATFSWRKYVAHKFQREAQQQTMLAQLERIPPDAPVECWLPYTRMVELPAVVARAQDTIRARPHLTFDLVGCLRRDDAPMREMVLDFVRGGGLPALSADSVPSAREALQAETESMRTRVQAQPDLSAVTFDPECLEAVFLAARYPGREAAFVQPLHEMRAVLDRLPLPELVPAGQQELNRWLRANDLNERRH